MSHYWIGTTGVRAMPDGPRCDPYGAQPLRVFVPASHRYRKEREMTLLELAERCEQATGPDYALDAAIWHEITPEHQRWFFGGIGEIDECWLWGNPSTDHDWDKSAPAYTASLDAAITLAPAGDFHLLLPGMSTMAMGRHDWRCYLDGQRSKGIGRSTALAICAAALRARAASVGRNAKRQDRNGLGPQDEHAVDAEGSETPND
jgi:hypothetical protein